MKYFLHDSSSFEDERISMLFMEYGYEGLGLFYTILEKLAKQEKPINTKVLKMQLKVGKKLEKCWSFMEEIEIISSINGETFNKRLSKFTESMDEKREKTSKRVSQFRENQVDTKDVTRYNSVSNAPNLTKHNITKEDTKVSSESEESLDQDLEEKKGKEPPKVPPKGSVGYDAGKEVLPYESEEFREIWLLWVKYRKEKKKTLTESTAKLQLKKLSRYSEKLCIGFIQRTIEKGWEGIVYEEEKLVTGQINTNETPVRRRYLNDPELA